MVEYLCNVMCARRRLRLGLVTAVVLITPAIIGAGDRLPDAPAGTQQRPKVQANQDQMLLQDLPGTARPTQDRVGQPPGNVAKNGAQVAPSGPVAQVATILDRMRAVERRLVNRDYSPQTTATQEQVVRQLDLLIDQLRRNAGKQAAKVPRRAPGDQRPPQQQRPPTASGKQAATQSDSTTAGGAGAGTRQGAADAGIRRIWGQLPERLRRQVQNANRIEFLPAYRQLIEDYYRRLAEFPDE